MATCCTARRSRPGWCSLPSSPHASAACRAGDAQRVRALLSRAGLPVDPPRLGRARMLELMGMDKKVRAARSASCCWTRIGRASVCADYPREALEALLEERAGA